MAWEYVVPAVFALLGLCVVLYQRRKRKKAEEVAAGIECYDGNGVRTLETSFLLTRMLGIAQTNAVDGSLINDDLNGNKFWIAVITHDVASYPKGWSMPVFSVSGNTLTWRHSSNDFSVNVNVVFAYGVY